MGPRRCPGFVILLFFLIAVHVLPTQASDLPKDNAIPSERRESAHAELPHPSSVLLCSVGKLTVDVRWFSIDNATSFVCFFVCFFFPSTAGEGQLSLS